VPISTFRARISHRWATLIDQVIVSARDANSVSRAERALNALLRQRHHIAPEADPDFSVRNLSDLQGALNAQREAISVLLLAIASVSLLVGGIGIMNIMLVSVTERTREIGIRLAIGARPGDILAQFLVEAVVLSAVGGLIGLVVGIGASYAVGNATDYNITIQPNAALLAVGISCAIGVAFGFLPARRAASLDPIVALRRE
jgi:putative ABC transport system permease protein